jgi:hypothetical protein
MNAVLNGRHLPPLDRIEYWAATLKLAGPPRDEFLLYARLAHCPAEIQSEYRDRRRQQIDTSLATGAGNG